MLNAISTTCAKREKNVAIEMENIKSIFLLSETTVVSSFIAPYESKNKEHQFPLEVGW
jgi:hypothetical protein